MAKTPAEGFFDSLKPPRRALAAHRGACILIGESKEKDYCAPPSFF